MIQTYREAGAPRGCAWRGPVRISWGQTGFSKRRGQCEVPGRNAGGSLGWGVRIIVSKHLCAGGLLAAGGSRKRVLLALPNLAGAILGSGRVCHVRGTLDGDRDLAQHLPWVFPDECGHFP